LYGKLALKVRSQEDCKITIPGAISTLEQESKNKRVPTISAQFAIF
jgi:hypothetical protein